MTDLEVQKSEPKRRIRRDRSGGNRLSNYIYEEVRNRICQLIYPPESVIKEIDFAQEFEVSRTPVRQVIQRLEIEGFVETRNGVGTIVTNIDIPAFRDVYEMRLAVTELIGRMSPRKVKPSHVDEMKKLHARASSLSGKMDRAEFWAINQERHKIILSLIGNSALRELYDAYYFRTSRVWYLVVDRIWDTQVKALNEELRDLVRALESADASAVAFVERNHLSFYLASFDQVLEIKAEA